MILLLMVDGSYAEIPRGADVIHRPGVIVCIDRTDAPLAVFSTEDVHAYTCRPSVARQMVEGDPSADVKQADTHRGRRRLRRRRV